MSYSFSLTKIFPSSQERSYWFEDQEWKPGHPEPTLLVSEFQGKRIGDYRIVADNSFLRLKFGEANGITIGRFNNVKIHTRYWTEEAALGMFRTLFFFAQIVASRGSI